MKAYLVYCWHGHYEQYMECDIKYFVNEKTAREYEEKLSNEIADDSESGVCFEEIEIDES